MTKITKNYKNDKYTKYSPWQKIYFPSPNIFLLQIFFFSKYFPSLFFFYSTKNIFYISKYFPPFPSLVFFSNAKKYIFLLRFESPPQKHIFLFQIFSPFSFSVFQNSCNKQNSRSLLGLVSHLQNCGFKVHKLGLTCQPSALGLVTRVHFIIRSVEREQPVDSSQVHRSFQYFHKSSHFGILRLFAN